MVAEAFRVLNRFDDLHDMSAQSCRKPEWAPKPQRLLHVGDSGQEIDRLVRRDKCARRLLQQGQAALKEGWPPGPRKSSLQLAMQPFKALVEACTPAP